MPGTAPMPRIPRQPADRPSADAATQRIPPARAGAAPPVHPGAAPPVHPGVAPPAAAPPTTGPPDGAESGAGTPPARAPRLPRLLRLAEGLAGLVGAGMLLLGVLLLVAQLLAPRLVDSADGPRWGVALVQLGVGAVAETLRAVRRRWPVGVRYLVACLTIAAVVLVLFVTWWR